MFLAIPDLKMAEMEHVWSKKTQIRSTANGKNETKEVRLKALRLISYLVQIAAAIRAQDKEMKP